MSFKILLINFLSSTLVVYLLNPCIVTNSGTKEMNVFIYVWDMLANSNPTTFVISYSKFLMHLSNRKMAKHVWCPLKYTHRLGFKIHRSATEFHQTWRMFTFSPNTRTSGTNQTWLKNDHPELLFCTLWIFWLMKNKVFIKTNFIMKDIN